MGKVHSGENNKESSLEEIMVSDEKYWLYTTSKMRRSGEDAEQIDLSALREREL